MDKFRNIAIYGAGSWGSALALACSRSLERVALIARDRKIAEEITREKTNKKYTGDIKFPANIIASIDPVICSDFDLILISVPSFFLEETFKKLKSEGLPDDKLVIVASKGLCSEPADLTSNRFKEIAKNEIAFIAGPNFAKEVAEDLPTWADIACENYAMAVRAANSISSENFKTTPMDDVITLQIAGVIKNILAIKAGTYEALGYGENARASLISAGLKEIKILSSALGGKESTLLENSVVGDLTLTCLSKTSRNTRFGYEWALSKDKAIFVKNYPYLVEGFRSAGLVKELIKRYDLVMPTVETMIQEFTVSL